MSDLSIIPSANELQVLKELGKTLVASGLLPNAVKSPEAAIGIMLKGKELGIPPMQAFSSIAIIQGKPTISSELMLALIYKGLPGSVVDFLETNNTVCKLSAKRPHGKVSVWEFNLEDAKKAGLLSKSSWVQYPAAMLRARCISAMARAVFPDALMGCSYTPEELGAEVSDEGEIIELESPRQKQPETLKKDQPPSISPIHQTSGTSSKVQSEQVGTEIKPSVPQPEKIDTRKTELFEAMTGTDILPEHLAGLMSTFNKTKLSDLTDLQFKSLLQTVFNRKKDPTLFKNQNSERLVK